MTRPPPKSTLFPYTTLFRSMLVPMLGAQDTKASAANGLPPLIDREILFGNPEIAAVQLSPDGKYISFPKPWKRSEEHTSELQSLAYLVCRLLLEKKKLRRHVAPQCTQSHNSQESSSQLIANLSLLCSEPHTNLTPATSTYPPLSSSSQHAQSRLS